MKSSRIEIKGINARSVTNLEAIRQLTIYIYCISDDVHTNLFAFVGSFECRLGDVV